MNSLLKAREKEGFAMKQCFFVREHCKEKGLAILGA
jgi:hypothetical protein